MSEEIRIKVTEQNYRKMDRTSVNALIEYWKEQIAFRQYQLAEYEAWPHLSAHSNTGAIQRSNESLNHCIQMAIASTVAIADTLDPKED